MNIVDTLAAVSSHGGSVTVTDSRLRLTAPTPLPPNVIEAVKAHKTALVEHLIRQKATTERPISTLQDGSTHACAAFDQNGSRLTTPDAVTLRTHLDRLYPIVHDGCRKGLHRYLDRVPAEIVKSIIASADPDEEPDTTAETCRQAGEAATLAALIAEYRERLRLLVEIDEDVTHAAAALELCLLY